MPAIVSQASVERSGEHLRQRWSLKDSGSSLRLDFEVSGKHEGLLRGGDSADHALIALLPVCMSRGIDVHVEGSICDQLLSGLEEWQTIWARWSPSRYRRVVITCSEVRHAVRTTADEPRRSLVAFSGGVDATYTLFRHLLRSRGARTVPPASALLVRGFDLPIDDDAAYRAAFERAESIIAGQGVELVAVSTNFRDLPLRWEDAFGAGLASVMHLVSVGSSAGLIGSGEPYDTLTMPWGSSPVTDPLLSSREFEVRHDGAEANRTEKIAWLLENVGDEVLARLRVCWEGDEPGRNCGRCEKCARTSLNFWAVGGEDRLPMGLTLSPRQVAGIRVRNLNQRKELLSVLLIAQQRRASSDPILQALRFALIAAGPRRTVSRARRRVRRLARR